LKIIILELIQNLLYNKHNNLLFLNMIDTSLILLGASFGTIFILILTWVKLYKTTTPDIAMVITGLGKTKVVNNGGCLVIPAVQKITFINLKTLKIDIVKVGQEALFTQDVHADVHATFFMRVNNNVDSIKVASESLGGELLNNIDRLKALLEGKFAGTLRSIAANMTLKDLQEKRTEFVQQVQELLSIELEKNGLLLEEVAITHLSQTDPEALPENDMFCARTRALTAQEVEKRRKEQNDAIQDNSVLINTKNVETEKKKYALSQDQEKARLEMEKQLSAMTADQQIVAAQNISKQQRESAEAAFQKDSAVAQAEAKQQRESKEAQIAKDVAIANKSKEQSIAETEANKAIKDKVESEQAVETAKQTAIAARNKDIAVIKAKQDAETEAVQMERMAEAEYKQNEQRANGIKILADANERHYEVEAEGKRKINEAENKLDLNIIQMKIKQATITEAAAIITALVKPMESIDKFQVISAPGLFGGNSNGSKNSSGNGVNAIYDGALDYRFRNKVAETLLADVGIDLGSVDKTMESLTPTIAIVPEKETEKVDSEISVDESNDSENTEPKQTTKKLKK